MSQTVPKSLRTWFVIHFLVDLILSVPAIFFPQIILPMFGFQVANLLIARIAGAALFAVGTTSLVMRNAGYAEFNTLLNLKLIWSVGAILAIIISLIEGAPKSTWGFLGVFIIFFLVWSYYKKLINS